MCSPFFDDTSVRYPNELRPFDGYRAYKSQVTHRSMYLMLGGAVSLMFLIKSPINPSNLIRMTFTAGSTYSLVMWFMLLDLNCQDADRQLILQPVNKLLGLGGKQVECSDSEKKEKKKKSSPLESCHR